MNKIFPKFKNYKYRNLICVISLVFFVAVLPHKVLASSFPGADTLNWVVYEIARLFGVVVSFMIGLLMEIAAYNGFTTSPAVQTGWKLMRDVCNMFFIVILMVIAVCTIIRVEAYNYKKMLPNLLIKAVLINFSLLFCGLLIDVSQVVTLTFVNAFKDAGKGNFIVGLGISKVFSYSQAGSPGTATTMTLLLGMLVLGIAAVVIGALVVVFLGRMIAFWILIVLSPFTFLASASGGIGSKYSEQWWSEFTKYLIVGPVLAFFLWLSLNMMREAVFHEVTKNMKIEAIPSVSNSEVGISDNLVFFVISIAMLLGSLVAAQQIGTAGSGAAGKAMGGLKGAAMWGVGAAMWVAKGVPSYANERLADWKGITLNPMDYINSWKKAREDKKRERMLPVTSHLDDIAHYGVYKFGKNVLRRNWRGAMADVEKQADKKRAEQKEDELRMELGGDKNAAGFKRLKQTKEKMKTKIDQLVNIEQQKQEYIEQIKKEAKKENKSLLTDLNGEITDSTITNFKTQIENIKQEIGDLDTEIKSADVAALTQEVIDEENNKAASKEQEIKNINNNRLSDQETHTLLEHIDYRLAELNAQQSLNSNERAEKANLESKRKDLKEYQTSIEERREVNKSSLNNIENITKSYEKNEKKAMTDELQKQVEHHKMRVRVMEETKGKDMTGDIRYNYADIKKRMADRDTKIKELDEKRLAMSGPDRFYRDSAQRALVEEERKKISDVKEASELAVLAKKAFDEKEFNKFSAIAKQMAANGDENELQHHFGYNSGREGFKDFFETEVAGKMGMDKQMMHTLISDISYIAEDKFHWNVARVNKNVNGEWRWNTVEEHTKACLAELAKKDDRTVAHRLQRLSLGGEVEDPETGKRTFFFDDLGRAIMLNFGQALSHHVGHRQEGTLNLVYNLSQNMGDMKKFLDLNAITDEFLTLMKKSNIGGGPKNPANAYQVVQRHFH